MKSQWLSVPARLALFYCCVFTFLIGSTAFGAALIVDHTCTDITRIPQSAILQAKSTLHIAYAHTSHGSQITSGMTGLVEFSDHGGLGLSLPYHIFDWNRGGANNALDLHDTFVYGDLGNPDRTAWAQRTRDYLDNPANAQVNVIMWSWCGQVDTSAENINLYLSLMSHLEADYPHVKFVYMTGHADGGGLTGNVHLRNQQIRNYCIANGKILFDFYDIECYNPDGQYFGDNLVDDACNYDGNQDGHHDGNWAVEWQNAHLEGRDWFDCNSAHSQPLNANLKAYAAWWLWASLAGWTPVATDQCPDDPAKTEPGVCGCGREDSDANQNGVIDCLENCNPTADSDNDGVNDCDDVFPHDPSESQDTDADGAGDNADVDDDNDGVADAEELSGLNNGDGNQDGVPDRLQDHVANLRTWDGRHDLCAQSAISFFLSNCSAGQITSSMVTSPQKNYPFGLLSFRINGLSPGSKTELTLRLPASATIDGYEELADHENEQDQEFKPFTYDGQTGFRLSSNTLVLHVIDGGRGDADGQADGAVSIQGSPTSQAASDGNDSGGGGAGGCFISGLLDFFR